MTGTPSRDRIAVANTADVLESKATIVEVEGTEVGLFLVDGEYHAVANYCVHAGAPLCEGDEVEGIAVGEDGDSLEYTGQQLIQCPWHLWKFDVETGRNVDDESVAVPTWQTEVEDGTIYVLK